MAGVKAKLKAEGRKPKPDSAVRRPPNAVRPAVRCTFTRMVPLADLKPNPRNPNQHPPEQLALYWKVIAHQGIRRPIVVSKLSGLMVTGHGLYATLKANGVVEVPVDDQEFKSPADEWAHLLADNRLPELAELDLNLVNTLETELSLAGLDLELTGKLFEPIAPPEIPTPGLGAPVNNFEIIVECSSRLQQDRIYKRLVKQGLSCRV